MRRVGEHLLELDELSGTFVGPVLPARLRESRIELVLRAVESRSQLFRLWAHDRSGWIAALPGRAASMTQSDVATDVPHVTMACAVRPIQGAGEGSRPDDPMARFRLAKQRLDALGEFPKCDGKDERRNVVPIGDQLDLELGAHGAE